MNWYKGKTLLESLDELKPPKRDFNGPLIISILNSDKITGFGTVIEGKILSGKLEENMEIIIPLKEEIKKFNCYSIEINHHQVNEVIAGDIIGSNIKRIPVNILRRDNDFLAFEENAMNNIKKAENLRVKILMIKKKATLKVGSAFQFFCYTLNAPIKVVKIEYLINEANKILEKEPKNIKNGGYAIIIIKFCVTIKRWGKNYDKILNRYYFILLLHII